MGDGDFLDCSSITYTPTETLGERSMVEAW